VIINLVIAKIAAVMNVAVMAAKIAHVLLNRQVVVVTINRSFK
jgi:hypothetical protein